MIIKSKQLRDSARGEDCAVRMPGICNFNPGTTVLAHLPCGQRGVGVKGPDMIAVYACSACHDAIDRRDGGDALDGMDLIRALAETQLRMIEKGLITIKGVSQ